jgi:hypothetical protein
VPDTGVDPGRPDTDEHLAVADDGPVDLFEVEDVR